MSGSRPTTDDSRCRLAADDDFWIQAAAGLAVFGSVLSVADRFQVKPLIRSVQWDGRYQVLALTLADARLFEGTRDTLDPVDLGDAPLAIAAAWDLSSTMPPRITVTAAARTSARWIASASSGRSTGRSSSAPPAFRVCPWCWPPWRSIRGTFAP